jgi:hypothetical protein
MKKLLIIFLGCLLACSTNKKTDESSPDGQIMVEVSDISGELFYAITYKNNKIIDTSSLGFDIKDMPPLAKDMVITGVEQSTFDETWKPVWGPVNNVRNHYNELLVHAIEKNGMKRKFDVRFRVFNDGVGFRYEFPEQEKLKDFIIMEENTHVNLTHDNLAWWIQAHYDSYEILYNTTKVSRIPSVIKNHQTKSENELYMKNPCDSLVAVNTPVTMQANDSLFICIHEAALFNYSEMVLKIDEKNPLRWKSFLVPRKDDTKVHMIANSKTPWRVVLIAEKPGDLITSHLVENLNEPCKIKDVSWIKPMKYMGIWWGYHIGKWSWNPGPKMGATTEHAMEYIDFASEHGIGGLLIEGWCVDEDWGTKKTFITPNKKFDLKKVVEYGKKKGVEIILHHETGGKVAEYEAEIDTAFKLLKNFDLHHVKTGYADYIDCGDRKDPWADGGRIGVDAKREYHSNERMINHYTRVIETAATNHVSIIAHEVIKGTGEQRTWPNMMAREGERGQEYNAWVKAHGNPPEHNTILPFTWMIGGPMDFTPGIFDITFDKYRDEQRVNTTLAQQLALYVVFYSPMQMAADLVENYRNNPAFKFITDVKVTWDTTIVLNGYPGDYLTIARKSGDEWFVGSITDEDAREITISLDFLDKDKNYEAEIYADSPETNLKTAPEKYEIKTLEVDSETNLTMKLCNGGGQAIRIFVK